MANTNYRIEFADAHGKGTSADAVQEVQSTVLGRFEFQGEYGGAVTLQPGDVLVPTGASDPLDLNTRAIVTSVDAAIFTARIVPVASVWAVAGSDAEAAYSLANPKGGWSVDGGFGILLGSMSKVEADGTFSNLYVVDIKFWDETPTFKLGQERLTRVVGTLDKPVFYDRYAKRAVRVEVDGTTGVFPGMVIRNAGNTWSATVIASDGAASPDVLYLGRIVGTLATSETITLDDGTVTDRQITLIGSTPTAGEWVAYSSMPMMGEVVAANLIDGNVSGAWELPPRGNWAGAQPRLGPDAELVHRGKEYHDHSVVVADQNYRHLKHHTIETAGDNLYGTLGGIVLQMIEVADGDEVQFLADVGTTISSGAWSATIVTTGNLLGRAFVTVAETNGEVLAASSTITSAGGSATALSTCIGWRKGSLHYEEFLAALLAAQADTDGLSESNAPKIHSMSLMPWECELGVVARSTTAGELAALTLWTITGGLYAKFVSELNNFLAEMRNDSRMQGAGISTATDIAIWTHKPGLDGSQPAVQPNGIAWNAVIENYTALWARQTNSTESHVTSSGFEMVPGSTLWLRPLDYVDLGRSQWRSISGPHVEMPTQPFEPLAIEVLLGQSQLVGSNSDSFLNEDNDREAYMSSAFPGGYDTTRPNVMQFNHKNGRIETFDLATGTNSAWNGVDGNWGMDATFTARMRERFGKILQFKLGVGGSCLSPNVSEAAGCWSKAGSVVGRASVTLSDLTFTDNGDGTTTITTATSGGFDALIGTTNAKLGTVSDDGDETICRVQLTSTNAFYNQDQFSSFLVNPGDYTSTTITVQSTLLAGSPPESITVTVGPPFIWPYLEQQWEAMCHQLVNISDGDTGLAAVTRYIPHTALALWEQGETDLSKYTEYAGHLAQFWVDLIELISLRIAQVDTGLPKCIVKVHAGTPMGSDLALSTIRSAQDAQAAALTDCALVDPSDLPLEADGATAYVSTRQENGVHHTRRGMVTKGYLCDQAMDSLPGIPPHPAGDNVADFGGANSGTFTSAVSGDDLDAPEEEAAPDVEVGEGDAVLPGTSNPINLPIVVEDGTGLANADSYITVAEFRSMAESIGNPTEISAASDAQLQAWLRTSCRFGIDYVFGDVWSGIRSNDTQALDWPRDGAADNRIRVSLANNTVPGDVKWCQFWYALALALEIDVLGDYDASDDEHRKRFATSTGDSLPGGLSEDRSFEAVPAHSILYRMHTAAAPYLSTDPDIVGQA